MKKLRHCYPMYSVCHREWWNCRTRQWQIDGRTLRATRWATLVCKEQKRILTSNISTSKEFVCFWQQCKIIINCTPLLLYCLICHSSIRNFTNQSPFLAPNRYVSIIQERRVCMSDVTAEKRVHYRQELIRRWDSERELLRSARGSYPKSLK